jgi:hypothetical protein
MIIGSQPQQIVHKTLSQKTHHKTLLDRVTQVKRATAWQVQSPKFKPQCHKKKKKKMIET